jgi:preprotein translocase subunit SecE
VARNRKRAKERRARRPQPVASRRNESEAAPNPIAHASPDVELAEAQLALGRPELVDGEPSDARDAAELEAELEAEAEVEELEDEERLEAEEEVEQRVGQEEPVEEAELLDAEERVEAEAELPRDGAVVPSEAAPPERRANPISRLVNFLRGCWRELQRVQWPDRRQVMQATGVVIGFVIVAGVFLGVSDWAAGKVMNYILTGHF